MSSSTVIHAWAKSGGKEAAVKAQQLLTNMRRMHQEGNSMSQPDTITVCFLLGCCYCANDDSLSLTEQIFTSILQYNVVINAWAKSGSKGAAAEAEKLLSEMHRLHEQGDPNVKPNVVTYGAVIDAYAKSGEPAQQLVPIPCWPT